MDGNFCHKRMVHYLNLELADTLGNLLNRTSSSGVNPDQIIPPWEKKFQNCETEISKDLMNHLEALPEKVEMSFENFNFYEGIVHVMDVLRVTNHFVQDEKPWELKKTDKERLQFVLALSLESLRVSGILLQPIIPTISQQLLNKLNVPEHQRTFQATKENTWNNFENNSRHLDNSKVVLFRKIKE
eukprot:TRINITY_DN4800_c0_g1_i6.p1 TRINITY_DN4800_c0_g1~~TRINITY_DN4800_c0_g1_i6.p1  ORF type:complete len:186 (-),score=17.32 TRINITY_DN4800_c0_g1_i6:18-575(-)